MKDLIFVIFGSTGDLTARKILPAISSLYKKDLISKNMKILALGRRDFTKQEYLEFANDLTSVKLDLPFLSDHLEYLQMQITQESDYQILADKIKKETHKHTKVMFYMAVGPELLPIVAHNLSTAQIITKKNQNEMLVFEKPFGHDLVSAKDINQMLFKYFDESQIYRIDHYLGKEMIQNILTIRFTNRIFDRLWNKENIAYIKVVAKEKDGILNRAGYYETAGAIKDMVQSHLLQMLALICMDLPKANTSKAIKDAKVNVLKNILVKEEDIILGQYEGYLQEPNTNPKSKVETAAFMKLSVDIPQMSGIPIYLLTGKKLSKKATYIEVTFKPTAAQCDWHMNINDVNKITFRVDPILDVQITLNSKTIGLEHETDKVKLTLDKEDVLIPEAYEKLLFDVSNCNQTLFPRWDEIEYAWRFVDTYRPAKPKLVIYQEGTDFEDGLKLKYNVKF